MKYINGDFYTNIFVSSASELVAYVISGVLYQKIGIKLTLVVFFGISIIGSVTYMIFGDADEALVPIMILGAKFGVSSTFNIAYLAMPLLFPAIFCSTAFGVCNIFARIATVIAPELAEVPKPLPMLIFTIIAVAALVSSLFIIVKNKNKDEDSKPIKN
jgi:hypothetical protein